jgi:acetyl esterase/lipase
VPRHASETSRSDEPRFLALLFVAVVDRADVRQSVDAAVRRLRPRCRRGGKIIVWLLGGWWRLCDERDERVWTE